MFYNYILYSADFDRLYIGQTSDLEDRLKRHNNCSNNSTAPFVPWILVLKIEKKTRSEACRLERKLKNLSKDRLRIFIDKYGRI